MCPIVLDYQVTQVLVFLAVSEIRLVVLATE